jgi:hypothetical protein
MNQYDEGAVICLDEYSVSRDKYWKQELFGYVKQVTERKTRRM